MAYEQHIGRRVPGQRPDGTFQTTVSRATTLGMQDLMYRWTTFAAADDTVQRVIVAEPRISGTDRRITWRTSAGDGSSIIVTSEPKKHGTASIVATRIGLATSDADDDARQHLISIIERFLTGLRLVGPTAATSTWESSYSPPSDDPKSAASGRAGG